MSKKITKTYKFQTKKDGTIVETTTVKTSSTIRTIGKVTAWGAIIAILSMSSGKGE